MNKKILFAALAFVALTFGFVACDVFDPDLGKENEDENDNIENVVDDDSTDIDSDSINNVEGEEDYYNCDTTEMICTGVAYNITATTAKVPGTIHIPLTLLAQCQLGVQVSSSKEDLIAHENVTNFTTKDLTGNDFVVNLKDLKSSATTHYYCAYIYLNGLYHYGPIREFKTLCVLTLKTKGDNATSTTIGAGEFAYGTEAPISTTSGENYYFTSWSDCDSKELTRTVMVTLDTTITANFAKKPYLTVKTNNASYGTVSGSGYYMPETEVLVTATPNANYYFASWSDGNVENPRAVVVTSDTTVTANFSKKPYLTVNSNNDSYGTVMGSGYYEPESEVTILAIPKTGYFFKKWDDGNTDNPRTIILNTDVVFTAIFEKEYLTTGTENGYEWVDLGLPSGLKWATCNVGANKPEVYGNYYAWGEVEPKEVCNWSTYKWMTTGMSSGYGINKYTIDDGYTSAVWYDNSGNFIGDNKTVLDKEDDAATVNMGGSWRMPTAEEQQELIDKCTWTWTTLNDVKGYNVEGPNGNSIFLPAAGYRSGSVFGAGMYGDYCLSSLSTNNSSYAYSLCFSSGNVVCGKGYERLYGQSVRGVCE